MRDDFDDLMCGIGYVLAAQALIVGVAAAALHFLL